MDNISIAMTFKNRANYLDVKLAQLLEMDYDLKKIEICITDGYSEDDVLAVIERYYRRFYQIKYAISDRSVLPPQPWRHSMNVYDMNAQICNQVTFEKVIRTDPEVLFTNKNQIKRISDTLNQKGVIIFHPNIYIKKGYVYDGNWEESRFRNVAEKMYDDISNTMMCFNRSDFISNGGYDERYALGYAGEDTYFVQWYKKNKRVIKLGFVCHLYHETSCAPGHGELNVQYTWPLYNKMMENNEFPNAGNLDWKRPEMLKDERLFIDG